MSEFTEVSKHHFDFPRTLRFIADVIVGEVDAVTRTERTGCPTALTVIAVGREDSHVAGCPSCCALYESVERAAVNAKTMADDLDCESSRALMAKIAVERAPSPETLAPLFTHCRKCAACRAALTGSADTAAGATDGTARRQELRQLARGEFLGRFQITGVLGEGGMGIVVSAYDPNLDRSVAIKVVHQNAFRGMRASQAEMRLVREAQAMAKIRHPNVITVYEVGKIDDQVFIAMEQVQGSTLGRWLKDATRSWQHILKAFRAAGEGLVAAHGAGLIHRDFKPDNVLVDNNGGIFVTDFGLVIVDGIDGRATTGNEPPPRQAETSRPHDTPVPALLSSLTRTGEVLGTPKYMAPEQHQGQATDARTDQFSFCVALWEALYGVLPFSAESPYMLVHAVCNGEINEPPKSTSVPDWILPILRRGLSQKPEDRFDTMKELLNELERPPQRRRFPLVAALGGGAVVVASVAAIFILRGHSKQALTLCEGADQEIAAVWDPSMKSVVRGVFVSSGLSYAPDTFDRVDPLVTAYTKEWVTMHTNACKAARVYGSESEEMMDRRISCLERRRYGLQTLIGLWRKADHDIIANAVASVRNLAPVSDCSTGELAATEQILDPGKKQHLEELQNKLATVVALLHSGKYQEGIRVGKEVEAAADTLGFAPFTAETLIATGKLRSRAGDEKGSVDSLERAYDAAETAGSARLKALSAIELTSVHAALQNFDEAQKWAGRARASIKNLGGDNKLEAMILQNVGFVFTISERFEEGLAIQKKSLELTESIYGPNDIEVAVALDATAAPLFALGRAAEAIPMMTRAIAIEEHELGKDHPALADLYNNLGAGYVRAEERQLARTNFMRSLAILEQALGTENVELANVLTNLGALSLEEGHPETAAKYIERAAAMEEKAYGPNNSTLGITLTHLANVRLTQGMYEDALTLARRAIAIHREGKHPNLAVALSLAADSASELAKQQWKDRLQRPRAITLAREALADLQESGNDPEKVVDLEHWISGHSNP